MRVLAVPKLVPRIGIAEQTCNNGTRPCFTITLLGLTKESHFEKLVSPLRVVPLSRALSHFTRHAHATRSHAARPPSCHFDTSSRAQNLGNKKPRRSGAGYFSYLISTLTLLTTHTLIQSKASSRSSKVLTNSPVIVNVFTLYIFISPESEAACAASSELLRVNFVNYVQ